MGFLTRLDQFLKDSDRRTVALPFIKEKPTTVYPNKGRVQHSQNNVKSRVKNRRKSF